MKKRLMNVPMTVLLFLGFYPFGIHHATVQSTEIIETFTHDGLERVYRRLLPQRANAAAAVPLVFNIRGGGGDWQAAADSTGFDTVAEREWFAIIYPNSVDGKRKEQS